MTIFLAGNDDMPPRLYGDFKAAKKRALEIVKEKAESGFQGGFNFTVFEVELNGEPVSEKVYIGCIEQQAAEEDGEQTKAFLFVQEYEEYEKPTKVAR